MRRISPGLWIALLFALTGLVFLKLAGLHYDASYELTCFYGCAPPPFRVAISHHVFPVMIIPYLGTLKAWLYLPLDPTSWA